MCLKIKPVPPMPADTAQIVQQLLPVTNAFRLIGERLSDFVRDEDFADLYPAEGKPALSPALLALVTVFQFWENLSDRQAAAMVVSRLDWKYALHLPLTYAGFDPSVLCEFRVRLLAHEAEARVFDCLLNALKQQGLLKGRHLQRTDSLAVLSAVRSLSRLELVMESLRLALNAVEATDADWLRRCVPPRWAECYGPWTQHERLVRGHGEAARAETQRLLAQTGHPFLEHLLRHRGLPVDLVRIDAIYNPVRRVNFAVAETRVGQRTDYDRLTVQVETNGTITPEDAIAYAAALAQVHFQYFVDFGKVPTMRDAGPAQPATGGGNLRQRLARPIDDFGLSVRSLNSLKNSNIRTLRDLVEFSEDDLLKVKNVGEKALSEIAELLQREGLNFGMGFEETDGELKIVRPGVAPVVQPSTTIIGDGT